MEPYTVALTSCGRFDLLERTLETLVPRLDGPLRAILISEDSGDEGIRDVVARFRSSYAEISTMVNDPPIGQIRSIDRLYRFVDTEWVFHCEDDWEFFAAGFIETSFALLKENERFSMVALRDLSEYRQTVFEPERVAASGIRYRVADGTPRWHGDSAGLHFNPGLRRMADYRKIGPYAELGNDVREVTVSKAYRDMGYRIACLAEPAVRHIGGGRSIRDPFVASGFLYRMKRSARKRLLKLRDRLEGESH